MVREQVKEKAGYWEAKNRLRDCMLAFEMVETPDEDKVALASLRQAIAHFCWVIDKETENRIPLEQRIP